MTVDRRRPICRSRFGLGHRQTNYLITRANFIADLIGEGHRYFYDIESFPLQPKEVESTLETEERVKKRFGSKPNFICHIMALGIRMVFKSRCSPAFECITS